jgi:hypothetical protein
MSLHYMYGYPYKLATVLSEYKPRAIPRGIFCTQMTKPHSKITVFPFSSCWATNLKWLMVYFHLNCPKSDCKKEPQCQYIWKWFQTTMLGVQANKRKNWGRLKRVYSNKLPFYVTRAWSQSTILTKKDRCYTRSGIHP